MAYFCECDEYLAEPDMCTECCCACADCTVRELVDTESTVLSLAGGGTTVGRATAQTIELVEL